MAAGTEMAPQVYLHSNWRLFGVYYIGVCLFMLLVLSWRGPWATRYQWYVDGLED